MYNVFDKERKDVDNTITDVSCMIRTGGCHWLNGRHDRLDLNKQLASDIL